MEWLASDSIPFVLVFTKTDKVTPAMVRTNIDSFAKRIAVWCGQQPEILSCSAKTKHGRTELLRMIEVALAADEGEAVVDSAPTAPKAEAIHPNPARPW